MDSKKFKDKCVICEEKIDKNNEKYTNLRDYHGKKFVSECFYHLECWKNRFTITQEKIQRDAGKWLDKLGTILNRNKEKVYEIQ